MLGAFEQYRSSNKSEVKLLIVSKKLWVKVKEDPFSVNEIELAMKNTETDEGLRSSLIQKGHQRKLDFSLDKTVELLWDSINKII